MKNRFLTIMSLLLTASLFIGFTACKKSSDGEQSYTCATCSKTPTAKAENNASNKGVYKGTVVGSSGVLVLDVVNAGTTATGTLTIDGKVATLTANSIPQAGQAYSTTFSGNLNGQGITITFSVGATGANPAIISSGIAGHLSAVFQLVKETADNLITCYEGTTTGIKDSGASQSGQLNLVVSSKTNTWMALSTSAGSSTANFVTGTVSGNVFTCDCGTTTSVVGTLSGDQINGTYKGADNHGTWVAKRTL